MQKLKKIKRYINRGLVFPFPLVEGVGRPPCSTAIASPDNFLTANLRTRPNPTKIPNRSRELTCARKHGRVDIRTNYLDIINIWRIEILYSVKMIVLPDIQCAPLRTLLRVTVRRADFQQRDVAGRSCRYRRIYAAL